MGFSIINGIEWPAGCDHTLNWGRFGNPINWGPVAWDIFLRAELSCLTATTRLKGEISSMAGKSVACLLLLCRLCYCLYFVSMGGTKSCIYDGSERDVKLASECKIVINYSFKEAICKALGTRYSSFMLMFSWILQNSQKLTKIYKMPHGVLPLRSYSRMIVLLPSRKEVK